MSGRRAIEMSFAEPTAHRYDRPPIDPEGRDSLAVLSRLVRPGSEVLDLGTWTGSLGRHLSDKGCATDGVEHDPAAAEVARGAYRLLVEADLEKADLETLFKGRSYDAVVCGDVLEHLREPGRTLSQVRSLLKPDGALLLSVPNVGYAGVLLELLGGEFNYRPSGILDSTHLRFYTRASLLRLLQAEGFHPRTIDTVSHSLEETEFGSRVVAQVAPRVLRAVLEGPDALVYQFIVRATLEAGPLQPAAPAARSAPAHFASQVFWRNEEGQYDEAHSTAVSIPLDSEVHEVRFRLASVGNDSTRLRFDPSDRPGLVQVHSLAEEDRAGSRLWSWVAGEGTPPLRPLYQLVAIPNVPVPTFVSLGDDPSLELLLPPASRRQDGSFLVARISLLPTPEALAMARGLAEATEKSAESTARFVEANARLSETTKRLTDADARLASLESRLARLDGLLAEVSARQSRTLQTLENTMASLGARVAGVSLSLEEYLPSQRDVARRVAQIEALVGRSLVRRMVQSVDHYAKAVWRRMPWAAGKGRLGPGDSP